MPRLNVPERPGAEAQPATDIAAHVVRDNLDVLGLVISHPDLFGRPSGQNLGRQHQGEDDHRHDLNRPGSGQSPRLTGALVGGPVISSYEDHHLCLPVARPETPAAGISTPERHVSLSWSRPRSISAVGNRVVPPRHK